MSNDEIFHPERELPKQDGWYEIRRKDGTLCIRAFGAGLWWIPLLDGWFSGLPHGFRWRGPIAEVSKADRSPLDECREVEASTGRLYT